MPLYTKIEERQMDTEINGEEIVVKGRGMGTRKQVIVSK